ncbi:MAG: RsmE family RNA methyltransferase [Candidatus Eutrophobiaceae bacterium]
MSQEEGRIQEHQPTAPPQYPQMRTPRVYFAADLPVGEELLLNPSISHRLAHVMRIKAGWDLRIFNHKGMERLARIVHISKSGVRVEILESFPVLEESRIVLRLALAAAKPRIVDLAIRKAVEMGVTSCILLRTDRCPVRVRDWEKQRRHLHEVIISATEQCGRAHLCILEEPNDFSSWLERERAQRPNSIRLFLHPAARQRALPLTSCHEITVLIGAEGGFNKTECALAEDMGCTTLSLGTRIMKVETAVVATLALCHAQYGDFREP